MKTNMKVLTYKKVIIKAINPIINIYLFNSDQNLINK